MTLEQLAKNEVEVKIPIAKMVTDLPERFGILSSSQLISIIHIMKVMVGSIDELKATKEQWISALNMYLENGEINKPDRKRIRRAGVEVKLVTTEHLSRMWEVLESKYPTDQYPDMHAKLQTFNRRILALKCNEINNTYYLPTYKFTQFIGGNQTYRIAEIIREYLDENPGHGINNGVRLEYFLLLYVTIKQRSAKHNTYIWHRNSIELVDATQSKASASSLENETESQLNRVSISYINCVGKLGGIMNPAIANRYEFESRVNNLVGYEKNDTIWIPIHQIVEHFLQDYKLSQSSGLILTSNSKNDPSISQVINGERCVNSDYLLLVVYSLANRLGMHQLKTILFTI
jgi:hypothetical protein